jgi:outer membrane protein assembly factor BamE
MKRNHSGPVLLARLASPLCLLRQQGHPPAASMRISSALLTALVASSALLAGCASQRTADSFLGFITPYRIDIVQGNAITREQAALVQTGMTRLQVREILGTPLLTDPFHGDRWDYLFTLRRPNAEPQNRHVIVHFQGETVSRIDAPDLPTEEEFVASISRFRERDLRVPQLELTPEQRAALPRPEQREAPPAVPSGPIREYPPLEGS